MSKRCEINIQMLHRLKLGDEKAFEGVFRRYYAKIYHFVLNTLYDKTLAEDITQNVFLSVWEHREERIWAKLQKQIHVTEPTPAPVKFPLWKDAVAAVNQVRARAGLGDLSPAQVDGRKI